MIIREERQIDRERIRAVNLAAFETSTEADLVDALRRQFDTIRCSETSSALRPRPQAGR